MPRITTSVQRGAAPRLQALHRPEPRVGRRRLPGEGEDVVVERDQRDLRLGAQGREERAGGLLQVGHGVGHALAHVEGRHQFEGNVVVGEGGHHLRAVVLEHAERLPRQLLHESAVLVGDDDRELHGVDGDLVGVAETAGAHGLGQPLAALQLRHDAHDVRDHIAGRVPFAREGWAPSSRRPPARPRRTRGGSPGPRHPAESMAASSTTKPASSDDEVGDTMRSRTVSADETTPSSSAHTAAQRTRVMIRVDSRAGPRRPAPAGRRPRATRCSRRADPPAGG